MTNKGGQPAVLLAGVMELGAAKWCFVAGEGHLNTRWLFPAHALCSLAASVYCPQHNDNEPPLPLVDQHVLLVLAGALASVFLGRENSLTVIPRQPRDRDILRVAYTPLLLPDPHRRLFPLSQYNELILCLWEPLWNVIRSRTCRSRPPPGAGNGRRTGGR